MARTYKKQMTISINNSEERDMLLNQISNRIKLVDLYISTKSGGLNITLTGSREKVKLGQREIKHIHKQIQGLLYPDKRGFYTYDIGFLFRKAGASIRIETLQKLLKYKGYKIELPTSDFIKSDAPLEVIIDLIRKVRSTIRETATLIKPKIVREQIAILAVLNDLDPFTVHSQALEEGLIRKEEEDRYSFTVNIDTFLKIFRSTHVEHNT